MPLPTIFHQTFTLKVPSTSKTIKLRPFTGKEYASLLGLRDSDLSDSGALADIFKDLIAACSELGRKELDRLASFDLEYIFWQISARSLGQKSKVALVCANCGSDKQGIVIDLTDISVDMSSAPSKDITISGGSVLNLRFPSIQSAFLLHEYNADRDINKLAKAFAEDLESVTLGQTVYDDYTEAEVIEFFMNLGKEDIGKIVEFYANVPRLEKIFDHTCKACGETVTYRVAEMQDFF